MLYWVYRLATLCAAPVLNRLLQKRVSAGKEDPDRLGERRGIATLTRPPGKLMWVHGASVGESLSVLPLLEELQARLPEWRILMTTGTLTSARLMAARLPAGVLHQFVPWDQPRWVARFFDYWRPDAVLWLESELWPNILNAIAQRQIPAALLNARMRPKTFAKWQRTPDLAGRLLAAFRFILVGARDYARYFNALGGRDVRYLGNLKFGAGKLPVAVDNLAEMRQAIGGRMCIGFMQTHPGEETLAAEVLRGLHSDRPETLAVIALRKPARGREVAAMLSAEGFNVALRSQNDTITAQTQIYIADTIGEMGLWYSLCPIVVIGGSFLYFGGQNPLEATHFGCAVLYGPSMFNFPELCTVLEENGAALPVASRADLLPKLRELLDDPARLAGLQTAARQVAADGSQVVDDYANIITSQLIEVHARA